MKSAQKNFQDVLPIFLTLLKPTALVLFWMSLLRALLFVGVFSGQVGFHPDLGAAFFAGFRFDIMVLGFFWIPIVVVTWVWSTLFSPRKIFSAWKIYWAAVVLIIFDLSWVDLLWTAAKNSRLNHEVFNASQRIIIDSGWTVLGPGRAMVLCFMCIVF